MLRKLRKLRLIVEEKTQKVQRLRDALDLQRRELKQIEASNAKRISELNKSMERWFKKLGGYETMSKKSNRKKAGSYQGKEVGCHDKLFLLRKRLKAIKQDNGHFRHRYLEAVEYFTSVEQELERAENNLLAYQQSIGIEEPQLVEKIKALLKRADIPSEYGPYDVTVKYDKSGSGSVNIFYGGKGTPGGPGHGHHTINYDNSPEYHRKPGCPHGRANLICNSAIRPLLLSLAHGCLHGDDIDRGRRVTDTDQGNFMISYDSITSIDLHMRVVDITISDLKRPNIGYFHLQFNQENFDIVLEEWCLAIKPKSPAG